MVYSSKLMDQKDFADSSGNLGLGESSSIDASSCTSGTDNTTLFRGTDGDALSMSSSCRLLRQEVITFQNRSKRKCFGTGDSERMVRFKR